MEIQMIGSYFSYAPLKEHNCKNTNTEAVGR